MTTLILLAAVSPDATASRGHAGHFVVDNDRLITVYAYVDGRRIGTIEPEQTEGFAVPTGYHRFEVRCAKGSSLFEDEELLRPRELLRAEVAAWEGLLLFENHTPFGGTVYVDGEEHGWLDAGDQRRIVLAPGRAEVTLRGQGRLLDQDTVVVRTGQRSTLFAEPPAFAELEVVNPLPVAVIVRLDGLSEIRLAPGDRQTLLGVDVGRVGAEVRLASSGRVIERRGVDVLAYEGGQLLLSAPDSAPIAVHNTSQATLELFVDGRLVATVQPYGDVELDLDVGVLRLDIRDERGRTIEQKRLDIDPFVNRDLRVGSRSASAQAHHRPASSCSL